MKFYLTNMDFSDGRHFVDYWVNENDAYNYWDAHKEKCKRAELFEMKPDENNFQFIATCLGEFDINGDYCYDIGSTMKGKF